MILVFLFQFNIYFANLIKFVYDKNRDIKNKKCFNLTSPNCLDDFFFFRENKKIYYKLARVNWLFFSNNFIFILFLFGSAKLIF